MRALLCFACGSLGMRSSSHITVFGPVQPRTASSPPANGGVEPEVSTTGGSSNPGSTEVASSTLVTEARAGGGTGTGGRTSFGARKAVSSATRRLPSFVRLSSAVMSTTLRGLLLVVIHRVIHPVVAMVDPVTPDFIALVDAIRGHAGPHRVRGDAPGDSVATAVIGGSRTGCHDTLCETQAKESGGCDQ